MNLNFNFGSCIVIYFLDFNFAFFIGFQNRINQRSSIGSKRNFPNYQGVFILLLNSGTDANSTATQTIVVIGYISNPTGGKIGIKSEFFTLEVFNRSVY